MPAAADSPTSLSLSPAPPGDPLAAALAPSRLPAGEPLQDAEDRALIADLIGARAAARVARVPVARLLDAGDDQLARLGLPAAARRRLLAGAELARRFQPAGEAPGLRPGPHRYLPRLAPLRAAAVEVLVVLPLDGAMGLLDEPCVVAGGAVMHVAVTAREVFAPAVQRRAAGVVLAHNHPSGTPDPSADDLSFTDAMARAGAVLGVRVVDHLVVARRGYFSFVEAGLIRDARP
jgi:DNA repair protein RadC